MNTVYPDCVRTPGSGNRMQIFSFALNSFSSSFGSAAVRSVPKFQQRQIQACLFSSLSLVVVY